MADWIKLDQLALVQRNAESHSERGVQINLALSPFDVPEALRGHFDAAIKRFVIEFRYMQEEAWSLRKEDEYLSLRIGRHSSRLHGIEIDVVALRAKHVALMMLPQIDKALARLSAREHSKRGRNYQVVRSVMQQEEPQLRQELAAAGVE